MHVLSYLMFFQSFSHWYCVLSVLGFFLILCFFLIYCVFFWSWDFPDLVCFFWPCVFFWPYVFPDLMFFLTLCFTWPCVFSWPCVFFWSCVCSYRVFFLSFHNCVRSQLVFFLTLCGKYLFGWIGAAFKFQLQFQKRPAPQHIYRLWLFVIFFDPNVLLELS